MACYLPFYKKFVKKATQENNQMSTRLPSRPRKVSQMWECAGGGVHDRGEKGFDICPVGSSNFYK
jgi:hypothetical protein